MVTYILLMKLTDKGAVDVKHAPERVVDAMKLWESMGGKTLGFYLTVGEFDYVAFGEGPDDRTAAAFALALSSSGTVRTTSLKAYSLDEAKQMVAALPQAVAATI
jgi:uncharacterized protein with GYD domain